MKKLLLLSSVILISGCAGQYTRQTQNQINSAFQKEMAAWETVQKLYEKECPNSTPENPLPRERALESGQCYESLALKHVMPVAIIPTETSKLLLKHKQTALDYKKGKIDLDESHLRTHENWIEYVEAIDGKANEAMKDAIQKDERLAHEQQQYFQNLSQQMSQAEIERKKSIQDRRPSTTQCHEVAGTLNCSTW